ncbi:MAG: MBL fold metallo-hydrolase [Desulfurivibrionaceae bacterium]|nr:MBL fold metallo-hydrolase [Desulfurivibrionaceae bacterium]
MKLTFLGTRGHINYSSDRHKRHTATLIEYQGKRVMIDCGEDWLGRFQAYHPQAIMITHCHPDHAWGLKEGAPCPVWASSESWAAMQTYPVDDKKTVIPAQPIEVQGMEFTYFPVEHSTRCPAGGYRISAGRVDIFYVPDVVSIKQRQAALEGCKLYVGDGATITRSMVRRSSGEPVGHTPLRTQLRWCQKEGVCRAVFTHLGSGVIKNGDKKSMDMIRPLARECGVQVELASDGMEMIIR